MNPYRIHGPALISSSGGRTSGYMLWHILDARDGQPPPDIHVCFADAGEARQETLRLVYECGTRWGVRIRWIEWRDRRKRTPVSNRFEEVGFKSASREGGPFRALVASKTRTPNAVERWCTEPMKLQVCADFMEARGCPTWNNVIGLCRDEQRRVLEKAARKVEEKNPWRNLMPLDRTRVNKAMVMSWSKRQPFDLQLEPWEGNCRFCMLKPRAVLVWEAAPGADLWPPAGLQWRRPAADAFPTEYSITDLIRQARSSPLLPLEQQDIECDAECGLWRAGEAA